MDVTSLSQDDFEYYCNEYIPSKPDKTLDDMEYYVMDDYCRVFRVRVTDIYFTGQGINQRETFAVCTPSGRSVRTSMNDEFFGGYTISDMYDNRKDCKNQTHCGERNWEALREEQQKRAKAKAPFEDGV